MPILAIPGVILVIMLEDIQKASEVLRKGGVILYPTDTVWGLGCDATNMAAAEKIYSLKGETEQKSLIILVESFEDLKKYVSMIPDTVIDLTEMIKEPITVVYRGAMNLASNVMSPERTIAVRIPEDDFCKRLLREFGKPITSATARAKGTPLPISFSKIPKEIVENVGYVVKHNISKVLRSKASIMVCISENGEIQILRN